MRGIGAVFVSLGLMLATAAGAQAVDPASDLGRFRALRAEGIAALEKDERERALELITEAGTILPDSPSILLLKAQIELELRHKTLAKAHLVTYLRRGMVLDLERYPEFTQVWDDSLEAMQVKNRAAVGELSVLTHLEGLWLAEGLTVAEDGTTYATALRTGVIGKVADGAVVPVIQFRPGVGASGLSQRDGALWASTAAGPQTVGFDPKTAITSKILKIDPTNGAILKSFSDKRPDRRLSDLTLGQEDLYVSDGNTGEVLRLVGLDGALEVLIPEGYLGSPQGLVEKGDATALIVADYSSGLYRVDLTTGGMLRLSPPDDAVLLGLDGLYLYGDDIIAVQNGFRPNRILRLRMSEDWGRVESVEVLLSGASELLEPTGGQVIGDRFVFIARSQWTEFDAQGAAKAEAPASVVIGEITLTP